MRLLLSSSAARAAQWLALLWLSMPAVGATTGAVTPPKVATQISSTANFEQALFEFHQAEQENLPPEEYLRQLSAIETRFAGSRRTSKRKIVIDAERCPYFAFSGAQESATYIASGIERATHAKMPIAENMFRLCELGLQGDTLDSIALDGVIARFNALESPYQKARALALRADVNSVRGDIAEALLDYQRARAAFARAGIPGALPNMAVGEAIARRRMGDLAGAEATLVAALPHWRTADNPRELAYVNIQLGFVKIEAGDSAAAKAALRQALLEARRAKDPNIEGAALIGLGYAQVRNSEWAEGLAAARQARALLKVEDPAARRDVAMSRYVEGVGLAGMGQLNAASYALDAALKDFQALKNDRLTALALKAKADLLADQGQPQAALETFKQYMAIEARLHKKMLIEQSTLLRQEYEIQSQAFETRELRINRLAQERQLSVLQTARRWQGLALVATLVSLVLVGMFAWRQWRRGRKLNVLAHQDPLTRLANRNRMEHFAQTHMSQADASGAPLSLLILDLDHFKVINDTYGHLVGDIVLKEVTRVWSDTMRSNDLLGRFGGEEFLALCPGVDLGTAVAVGNRLRQAAANMQLGAIDPNLKITVSVGVAQYVKGETRDQWIERADRALYAAKQNGRDRVEAAPRAV
ncbi:GGDEF domain-containing protein [Lysobacter soyae]|uniref:diguanylate cyclase n=1 Tax=Lysobacter soyae TaxID=2764185 RepID=A0ABX8WQR8_9GAMM|nr:GGDEF domain-containing protein [Lysobacter sp. CJ11]QYR53175.1 GGDEF domain-containing protein [Lysobacter sp. CJ11]